MQGAPSAPNTGISTITKNASPNSPNTILAKIYYENNDISNTIKYAEFIINTPMQKYTERGVEMKKSAQKMLNELGVPCDDPGIVVFDIHDRSTWNEGKW